VKKVILFFVLTISVLFSSAQRLKDKNEKREARREKINELIKQSEEGILIYNKQSIFGVQFRTNGYGLFYELGKMKTNRKTNIYRFDLTEIKDPKEDKTQLGNGGFIFFGNPFIYGKINNFYQATFGFGQQHILGQKGNKNGVAVSAVYNGGLAIGLLRPYYLDVQDMSGNIISIKYDDDNVLFLDPSSIAGGGGIGKGWGEMKIKPGAFLKTAIRFDYGRFNEMVSGIEVGLSGEFYSEKIPILANQDKNKQFFVQGYLSLIFGRRK
jgi:hypothetical protein